MTSPDTGTAGPDTRVPDVDRCRRVLVLATCCLSLFLVTLDTTIVNVALPAIGHDLHATVSGLQWTIDAYTLVLASLFMAAGSTGDRIGQRRVFQAGLVVFAAGSLLCSLAPNLATLVGFRALQGVGAAALNPPALSIITNVFTDRRGRARAIGVWGGVIGIGFAFGPPTGGLLVQSSGWRAIFWINIPVSLAAVLLAARFVPESRAAQARRADPVGQLLVLVALLTLISAIIEGPRAGWTSPLILGCFLLAAAAAAALIGYEHARTEPLLDPRLLRGGPLSRAALTAVTGFAAVAGFLFLNTLYLQTVRGLSPVHAGLLTLPLAAAVALAGPVSGRLVAARGPRLPLVAGGIAIAAGSLLLTGLTAHTPTGWLTLPYLLFGTGFGLINPPITSTAVSGMPAAQAGTAAAIASASRQVGQSLGVAVVGSLLSTTLHEPLAAGFPAASRPGLWIISGCGALVSILSVAATGRPVAAAHQTTTEPAATRTVANSTAPRPP